jgi:geranylgeranyl diphosphate synthase type I
VTEDLAARFESAFDVWLEQFRDPMPTLDMLRYHFGYGGEDGMWRGKRLRPRILLQIVKEWRGHDPSAIADGLQAACAIELLHNYSLIHDDIEDGDRLRHGREALWARYGAAHGINAGDALCSISYLSLLRSGAISGVERAARLSETLLEAHYAMCLGQGLDIAFETRAEVSYDDYLAMTDRKTAALFGASCAMGAVIAGLPEEQVTAYTVCGRAYGQAFQIRDDILGTWGAVESTGKPSGADIARRKWCFPVVWALAQPPSGSREVVAEAYARRAPLDAHCAGEVVRALERLGARAAADAAVARLLVEATERAESAAIDQERALHRLFHA